MKITQGLSFDDVLLVPKFSNILSRKNVDLSVNLGNGIYLTCPVVSANMKNITETAMTKAIAKIGGLAILHRFCSVEEQISMLCCDYNQAASIGVHKQDKDRAIALVDSGCRILCIDVAHGHSRMAGEMTEYIAKAFPHILLIAGNVCTAEGARFLYNCGADVIKCGIGCGALCTTRIETGNGVPQMTALDSVYQESLDGVSRKFKIIADGGIRNAGDCVKALVFSDLVMLGSIISGTDECPGEIQHVNGQAVKSYEGSSTHKTNHIEGVKKAVALKGPVTPIIEKLLEGIASGLSYQGAANLSELKRNAEFVQMSTAGLTESHPHGLLVK